jgi:hypothetical protein
MSKKEFIDFEMQIKDRTIIFQNKKNRKIKD